MSQDSALVSPNWIWDAESQSYCWYDHQHDQLVWQNGSRTPRSPHIPIHFLLRPPSSVLSQPRSSPAASQSPPHISSGELVSNDDYYRRLRALSVSSAVSTIAQSQAPNYTYSHNADVRKSLPTAFVPLSLQNSNSSTISTSPTVSSGDVAGCSDSTAVARGSIQLRPGESMTELRPDHHGVRNNENSQRYPSRVEQLDPTFKRPKKPKHFFVEGKVFLICWVEPAAESKRSDITGVTSTTSVEISKNRYGESVFSKVRRFVVIREGDLFCTALPILTYNGKGVGNKKARKSDHAIIHAGREPPAVTSEEIPVRGEQGMRPYAIRVDPDTKTDKLDDMSRIDFGKPHTIHHNLKVKSFGKVNRVSMQHLKFQFQQVWEDGNGKQAPSTSTNTTLHMTPHNSSLPPSEDMWLIAYDALVGKGYTPTQARDFLQKAQIDKDAVANQNQSSIEAYDLISDDNETMDELQSIGGVTQKEQGMCMSSRSVDKAA